MAKVKLGNIAPGATPLNRAGLVIRDTRHGPVAQAWPKSPGPRKTPYDRYKVAEFSCAGHLAANPHPFDFICAVSSVKGTTLVPRDWLTMCAYGRAYEIELPDGTIAGNFRDVAPNPQYVLDLIGDTVGAIIYRAEVGWVLLDPGSNGQIVTMLDGLPAWLDNTGPYVPPDVQAVLNQLMPTSDQVAYFNGTDWVAYTLPAFPSIQSQLASIGNTAGDILVNIAGTWSVLAPGSNGDVLHLASGLPAWVAAPWGTPLYPGVPANLTAGYTSTAYNNGNKSSGTFTPDPANGNLQRWGNTGAHTLAPPSVGSGDSCSITLKLTNGSGAGAITTSSYTKVKGDAFDTTNGHKFMCTATIIDGESLLTVAALQ